MVQHVEKPFLQLAEQLANAAAVVVRRHFRTPIAIADKDDASPVTIADRDAESAMRTLIEATFPSHGIIGEEFGAKSPDAEWVWVLDPIDGTKAFITGKPSFGTLIGLMHRGRPVLGVIDQAITRERWVGAVGHGSTLNGEPIRCRPCPDLALAALYTTDPVLFEGGEDRAAYDRLEQAVKLHRYGTDCYAYGLLAAGFVDVVCEAQLKLHDFIALAPVIEGAGGMMTDWSGQPLTQTSDGRVLAAGDPACHAQALARLKG